jgi:molybdopterin synthase sulfur carrier subunit
MAAASIYLRPIRLRLFASLREQAGWEQQDWAWPDQSQPPTPEQIWRSLGLTGSLDELRIAVNFEFAGPQQPLQPGDELAFLSPISGG